MLLGATFSATGTVIGVGVAVGVRVAVTVDVAVAVAVAVGVLVDVAVAVAVETSTATGWDGIPFATTTNLLAPVSMLAGTSNSVETGVLPVATAIVLWL